MYLGTYFGQETLECEFKKFYLKLCPSTILDDEEILEILDKGILNKKVQGLILENLNLYIKYYLPKYISCFTKANINGKLMIGIDDNGEITGIPSSVEINEKMVYKMIQRNLFKYLNMKKSKISKFIKNNLSIKVEKLEVDNKYIDDHFLNKLMESYNKYINNIRDEKIRYKKSKKEWLMKLGMYQSLSGIINNKETRKVFIKYLENLNNDNFYDKMITELKTTEIFVVPDYKGINRIKSDNTNVFYWLMKFKDIVVNELVLIKPQKKFFSGYINLKQIFCKISNLNSILINNKNINFYVLKINILGNNKYEDIFFRYPCTDEWITRKRILVKNKPGCI